MSVYKPAKSRFWHYDFVVKGRRHHGSTGTASRRAAERFEDAQRKAAAEGKLGDLAQLSLDQAFGKWWAEVGQFRGESDRARQFSRLQRLVKLFPNGTTLADLSTALVSDAVQRRRGIPFKRGKDRTGADGKVVKAKEYAVSNSTVNRDVIQPLRAVVNQAVDVWEVKGLNVIAWGKLTLAQPRPTVRVYSQAELAAWAGENGPTARLAHRLLSRYGLRFGELFFKLHAYEPDGHRLGWYKGRKKDVWHTVPLLPDDDREIAARVARAQKAGLDTIWFVEVVTEVEGKRVVTLEALTYHGMRQRILTASKRAGIRQGRVIHGLRHHVGTAIQRTYKDRKVTQRLLGHIDSKSTDVYVHAMDDDVYAALLAVEESRNSPGPRATDPKKRKRA